MGAVISGLVGAVKGVKSVIGVIRGLSADYNEVLARANKSPGLPVANPTVAFWQEDPPFPGLVNVRSPELPQTADIVIVGSGIAAAAIARSVLHESRRTGEPARRIVVCEARSLCSGATGRNGGHIKPSAYESFARLCKRMSPQRAAELIRFQLRHLDTFVELCRAEHIDIAECREVETADFFLDDDDFSKAVGQVEELRKWVPEHDVSVLTAAEAREKFSVNEQVKGALAYKAGALWPYRFVTSIWNKLLSDFPKSLSLETMTAVEGIEPGSAADFPYAVSTSRGTIRARHVVHATNGFAPHLVPGLRGKAIGILAQMTAQRPGRDFPDLDGRRSWSVIYGSGFDYATQRPTSPAGVPGHVLLGGGFSLGPKQGMENIAVYDDSKMGALANAHNLGIMAAIFEPNWGPPPADDQGGKNYVWSGIVAISADAIPLVGKLDPRVAGRKAKPARRTDSEHDDAAEWIAAAFIGDGMVWAWLSGTALGVMIMGSDEEELAAVPGRPGGKLYDWFPRELLPTYKRVRKMDLMDLAEEIM
ncbi:FAD dependent oxidoreductase-domain-containing protein [Lasiosphaeria miniovina]|uniref:FAD dependent oxidoreductase-domain-containing protein n=1 Tax=Lasiosphaeria miniovina TaxID=1954250 RepID=A0AA40DN59_9PEZI|nr:FAD dependent oxidoreductase-domain-containing protein [Lasiosphaeria miniovina]KAK0705978.1 FAD dependent oxidoreductase-domain-containing protein [Lasiosphaeria miniovina]